MSPERFKAHHTAISVRDLERTASFYGALGFRLCVRWQARDGSLTIAHFGSHCGHFLEVFHYAKNAALEPLELALGNDLTAIGVKHLAFSVDDIEAAREELLGAGFTTATPIQRGRTEMNYFFVRDPDGMWVEVTQDDRHVDPERPIFLEGS
jgi:catechol 2,3-dioxygenase-like lactoylglutathione lyase family enzyme